jgi:hypothetical protein
MKTAIITPLFNASNTIGKTINCILKQSYKDFNLIIVNDKSTDNSLELVKSYKDERIVIINLPENKGPSFARNRALDCIYNSNEFKYVAFCDADDFWEPNHLELSIDTMLKTGNKICFSDPIKKDLNGNIMIPFGIPTTSEGVTYEQLKIVNSIFISTVVVETDLLKSIGYFNSEFDAIEDWDLWLRILRNNSYCRHKENTVTYNVNPNGMAGKSTNQKMNKMLFQYLVIDQPLVKLNLGCGNERIPGYINCDLYEPTADAQFDAKLIPLPDNSVDEIRAYHLIEHFTFHTAFDVLKEWKRVLKPNGKLVLETPDFYQSCKRFVWACEENNNDEQIRLYSHFFAWPDLSPGQVHYFLYTENQLLWTLKQCGYTSFRRVPPDSIYAISNPHHPEIYMKIEVYK